MESQENPNAAPSALRCSTLGPLTEDLQLILGQPNFTCGPIAELFRRSGRDIPRKAGREQAFVIHWMVEHYLKSGDNWRVVAENELEALQPAPKKDA